MKKFLSFILIAIVFSTPILFISLFIIGFTIISAGETKEYVDHELTDYALGEIPTEFIDIYKRAGDEYNIPWLLLPAIHKHETSFSQNIEESSHGAVGHMQFQLCTWVGWSYSNCADGYEISHLFAINPDNIAQYGGY